MALEQQRLTSNERANLVAYLDGELNAAETQAIATKLTSSPPARRELESLRRTWELLDALPRPPAPADFTARTLAGLDVLAKADNALLDRLDKGGRVLLKTGLLLTAAAVAFAAGYAATRWAWPDPTARLVRDLSLAEHLDEYRDVGTFSFLQRLDELPELQRLEGEPGAAR